MAAASNQLIPNHPTGARARAHLMKHEDYLKQTLNVSGFSAIDWKLRSSIINWVPKHLRVWLSKSLLNFSGTVHQLHRQKSCSSAICRCCVTELESDAMCVIDCSHDFLMNFKQDLFVHLQKHVLALSDTGIAPLLLLESMLQKDFTPVTDLLPLINQDLHGFGRINLWHGIFSKSLSD